MSSVVKAGKSIFGKAREALADNQESLRRRSGIDTYNNQITVIRMDIDREYLPIINNRTKTMAERVQAMDELVLLNSPFGRPDIRQAFNEDVTAFEILIGMFWSISGEEGTENPDKTDILKRLTQKTIKLKDGTRLIIDDYGNVDVEYLTKEERKNLLRHLGEEVLTDGKIVWVRSHIDKDYSPQYVWSITSAGQMKVPEGNNPLYPINTLGGGEEAPKREGKEFAQRNPNEPVT